MLFGDAEGVAKFKARDPTLLRGRLDKLGHRSSSPIGSVTNREDFIDTSSKNFLMPCSITLIGY